MDDSINTGPVPVEQIQDTPEFRRLTELEQVVRRGLSSNPELIAALAEIHGRKLYKARGYKGFQAYLKEHWGISRAHGYRLIAAANAAKELETKVSPNETTSETDRPTRQPATPKPKRSNRKSTVKEDQLSKSWTRNEEEPEQSTRIVTDVDEEFEGFKEDVEAWKGEFLPDGLRPLLEQVREYVDEILAGLPEPELEEAPAL